MRILLWLLLLLATLESCSETSTNLVSNNLVVVVTVTADPGSDLVALRPSATVNGQATTAIAPIPLSPNAATKFSIKLPNGSRGELKLTLEGKPVYAYITHLGRASVQLEEDKRYDLAVNLVRNSECSDTGWCWERPLPRGDTLHDVWGVSPDDFWIVGEGGTILHYDGWAFSRVPVEDGQKGTVTAAVNPRFRAIHGTSSTDVWAVSDIRFAQGQSHLLCKYNPARKVFDIQFRYIGDLDLHFHSLWVSPGPIWIGGNRWDRNTGKKISDDLLSGQEVYRMIAPNPEQKPDEIWAVGNDAIGKKLAIWKWDGASWVPESTDSVISDPQEKFDHIFANQAGEMWTSSNRKQVSFHLESGIWKSVKSSNNNWPHMIYGQDQQGNLLSISGFKYGEFSGTSNKIIFSGLSSVNGISKIGDTYSIERAFQFNNGGKPVMAIVGQASQVQLYDVTTNKLTALLPGSGGNSATLNDVFGFSANDVWAVGDSGSILHFTGQKWEEQTSPTTAKLRRIWGVSSSDMWIVGDGGTLLHRSRPDGSFEISSSGVIVNLNGIWGLGSAQIIAVGDSTTLLRWNGTNWTAGNDTGVNSGDFQAVWASSPNNIWLGGTSGGSAFMRQYDGEKWNLISLPAVVKTSINNIRGTSGTNVAITYDGTNGGPTQIYNGTAWNSVVSESPYGVWSFSPSDTYSIGHADTFSYSNTSSPQPNDTLKQSVGASLFMLGLWGTDKNNLWAVGESGAIIRYHGVP